MALTIIKEEQYKKLREEFSRRYPYKLTDFGEIVCYEMPALESPFPKLQLLLEKGEFPALFHGVYYLIKTDNEFIERVYPASEYYKIAFRSLSDSLYSMNLNVRRIKEIQTEINKKYSVSRKKMPSTGQPSFSVFDEVYNLKSELGSFFFVSRSLLDTIATLMHFLCGPKADNHRSFSKFIKSVVENKNRRFSDDDEMIKYFSTRLYWYNRLKDVRDHGTHYKNLDISFYEQEDETIQIYLEDLFELEDIVQSVQFGIIQLLKFMDDYFTERIDKLLADMSGAAKV